MKRKIDKTDTKIINLLQKNGRISNTEIAKQVGISETTVRYRLQNLTNEGFIEILGITNPFKLGFGIEGSIRIKADIKHISSVSDTLKELDALYFIGRVTGKYDFDTEFCLKSMEDLGSLVNTINMIPGVLDTEVAVLMEYIKERYDVDWETLQDQT
jgi:Lrp/AsnC family transcriptional regulator, regulator for asnA, asnC and gidA